MAPRSVGLGKRLSCRQWRVVRTLEFLVEDANSVDKVDAQGMGRTAAKAESQHLEIGALHRALATLQKSQSAYCGKRRSLGRGDVGCEGLLGTSTFGEHVGYTKAPNTVVAKALVSDRLHFGDAPCFDPTAYLDSRSAAMYNEPQNFHKDEYQEPPAVSIRASISEKLKLYRKLASCKRLGFLAPNEVEEQFSSGLFSVVKNLQKDRLIMDSRPANVREIPSSRWTGCMASAAALTSFEIRDGECLRCSGQDVSDYFYQFVVSSARLQRNVLHGRLTEDELVEIFQRRDPAFRHGGFVGLNTMAMGDLRACEFAQGSHMSVLLEANGFVPQELIMMHQPLPRSLLSIGIVIDDLVILERVASGLQAGGGLADERMEPIKAAYKKVGLPLNEAKEFRNKSCASFWGIELDGDAGLMRANSHRVWPLVLITLRTCMLGLATIGLLESLSGSWISVLMLRRRMLSLMSEIFNATSCGLADGAVVRLSDSLKDELMCLVTLGPLAAVNLRAKHLCSIRATDSSDWGFAAVSTVVSEEVAREAYRCSLTRSSWSRLLPPFKAWQKARNLLPVHEELPEEKPYSTHPLWEILARGLKYKEEWRQQHDRARHINITELAAVLKEEKRLATNHSGVRVCYGLDSQVALGSLVKGRSSSAGLNRLLWKSISTILGSDMYGGYGFFPTSINRADAPTRGHAVADPDLELPAWWSELEAGDFSGYDSWLKESERLAEVDTTFPDFSDLGFRAPIPLATGRQERSDKWLASTGRRRERCRSKQLGDGGGSPKGVACSSVELAPAAIDILSSFSAEQVWWPAGSKRVFEKPGALDLFTGRGGVARILLEFDCPFVVTFEWQRSATEDLLLDENRKKILQLVRLRAVLVVGSALICASFSRAITPAVRTLRYLRGVPWMSAVMKVKVTAGNSHSDFAAVLIDTCIEFDVRYWLENPDSSFLWQQKKMRRYRSPSSSDVLRVDYCRFGTAWRKRTRVATDVVSLRGLRFMCTCKQNHVPLRGMHPSLKKPWTAVAEPYPKAFARLLAYGIINDVGWHNTRLNIAGCARVGSLRIGESKNPGPRLRREPRGFSLEYAPVQFASSILIGEKCWEKFLHWISCVLVTTDPLTLFLRVPLFMAHAIRKYGDEQFAIGGALMYYRHLVIISQKKVPSLRQYVHVCWELATRWEAIEPVVHRTPVPKSLVHALVSLAWGFRWYRWAAVTMICFAGIARIGEVLRCRRGDLLLPRDILDDEASAVFILLARSKTSYRSKAVVQHLKIDDSYVISLLDKVFGGYDSSTPLYHGSPSVYRTRWNKLMKILGCDGLSITPGGLRGGGAVAAYREGKSLPEIMWRMRLRSQQTLESYLQEVSALGVLSSVSSTSLHSIRSSAALYWHLVHADGV